MLGVEGTEMWQESESVIKYELGSDETLLWAAQPKQGIVFRSSDIFLIPFSLLWGGFAIFWEIMALSVFFGAEERPPAGFAIIFPLWGIPFVIVGLYMMFGRFLVDSKRRAKTFYGLTNQRIIVVSGLMSRKVKSMNLRTLSDISLTEKSDGTGTITFGPSHPMSWWFGGASWPGAPQSNPSFEMIEDAKGVYDNIRIAQSET
jgi:hypothetical protein